MAHPQRPGGSLAPTHNDTMPFKYDANGAIALQEINGQKLPVFIHPDGKEVPFDAESTLNSMRSRTEQSARVEGENKALKDSLKSFEGITDADAARKALETVRNIDQGQLIAAGKVEEIKVAAKKAAEEQVAAAAKTHADELARVTKVNEGLTADLYRERIGGAFGRSKFIVERCAVPADLVQARFGHAFKIEDGKVVAYDPSGNKIYSRAKPGEIAEFDEALETLIDQYQYREQVLKGANASGGGARGGGGSGTGNGGKRMTRAEFSQLDPAAQAKTALDKTVEIVD